MQEIDDYTVYNMPSILSREVLILDMSGKFVPDISWKNSTRETFFFLFKFLQDNSLLKNTFVSEINDVDNKVIRFSDFTDVGKAFLKAGIDDKWLDSLDRKGAKKNPSNVEYMQKQLRKIVSVN